jgi:hypothetical protein
MLHASFTSSLKQYLTNNDDKVRRFSLRNMHRRHVTFSALVANTFLNAMFSCASPCQGTDFHFVLLPSKPNTADYKGTG